MTERLLTPEQVAEHLQLPVKSVQEMLRVGEIRGIKVGRRWRVDPADLDRYIDSCRRAA